MQDFVSLCRGGKLRGMGKAVTHAVARWLSSMSEYHAVKYGAESQSMSLRDLYRLSRPKLSATSTANAVARALVKGDYSLLPQDSQLLGYQAFKAAAGIGALEEALALVARHRLPWEVVTGQFKDLSDEQQTTLWRTMLYQMPYMAEVRNLNNMVRYHVTDDPEALEYIVTTLSDPERVAHSKQLPFRFYSAMKAITTARAESSTPEQKNAVVAIEAALQTALELSFTSMPELGASVLIANDISGSMSSRPSPKSDMTMAEIAGIFAAAVFKKAEHGAIVSFNQEAVPRTVGTNMSLADIAKAVSQGTGGTSLSAPLEYAFGEKSKRVYDTAIFITDSESWYDHLTRNRGALDQIREYKKRVNANLLCFFVQLLPYKHAVVPQEEPGCFYLYGWNAGMLSFIAQTRSGGQAQVDAVRQVSVL
jgi:60 kDa SS-A/Ro ribonucleoprotein